MPFTARGTWVNSRRAPVVLHIIVSMEATQTVCGLLADRHCHTTTQPDLSNCPACLSNITPLRPFR